MASAPKPHLYSKLGGVGTVEVVLRLLFGTEENFLPSLAIETKQFLMTNVEITALVG
jgi:hypothetical protein